MHTAWKMENETKFSGEEEGSVPEFRVDPFWPKPLPNNWLIGQVAGLAVDSADHIWIIHRPNSLGEDEGGPDWAALELPFVPAPPVMQFDAAGNLMQAWGGPGEGYEWPEGEHGIFIDHENNVWIGGAGSNAHQVLKFTSDGKFLLQIGKAGKNGGSNSKEFLGRPTDFDVDSSNGEIYIADGYLNNRIVVFDAHSGKYKRHWGAYGHRPEDASQEPYDPNKPAPAQFGLAVHAVRISHDKRVYVCDRSNNRIQVFLRDGTFLFEEFVAKNTLGIGATWDLDFSHDPQQRWLYVADGANQCIWVLMRDKLRIIGKFGRIGRNAGQFIWLHNIGVDSKGNLYTGEVYTGKRAQKFLHQPSKT